MSLRDFTSQRLYVREPLSDGASVALLPDQASYLRTVLRLGAGDEILIFNGRDGEWRAGIDLEGKRGVRLRAIGQTRSQEQGPNITYAFAPLKRARLDYMVQKAVELGAARLVPLLTQHTVAARVNLERMEANAIEAAEQCGILRLPAVEAPVKLSALLVSWDPSRLLVFCDEELADAVAGSVGPIATLTAAHARHIEGRADASALHKAPRLGVLIGPEGGFSASERALIRSMPWSVAISLGPRIMRADTAAVAALALVGAVLGDWPR